MSGCSDLAKTVVDPHDHKPVRLPTFPNIERTSILPFVSTTQSVVSASGTSLAMLCRSPVAPLWFTQTNTHAGSSDFAFTMGSSTFRIPLMAGEQFDLRNVMIGKPNTGITGTWPWWYGLAVDRNNEYWFWAPAGMTVYTVLYLSAGVGSGAWTLEYEYTQGFQTSDTSRVGVTVAYSGGSLVSSGITSTGFFFRPLLLVCNTTSTDVVSVTNITVKSSTNSASAFLPGTPVAITALAPLLRTAPEFSLAPKIYSSCRLNACSALFQNTTAVLSKEGSVEAVIVSSSAVDPPVLSATFDYTSMASDIAASCRYTGLLEKGFYTFSLPDVKASTFRDCGQLGADGGITQLLNLDSFDYLNIMRFTDYSSPATNLLVTVDVHHEFRNTSMLWPVGFSTIPLEEWHKAQIVVQGMLPFFENPTHLMAIANLARAAAIRLYPIVRPVATAALAAARDKVLSMAAGALRTRMGQTQVPLRPSASKGKPKPKPKARSRKRKA